MKDEYNSIVMLKYVGLRSKSYACKAQGKCKDNKIISIIVETKMKNKGSKKCVVQTYLSFEDFVTYLHRCGSSHANRTLSIKQNIIASKNCTLYSISQEKVALGGYDIKRQVMDDNVCTLPLGYAGSSNGKN